MPPILGSKMASTQESTQEHNNMSRATCLEECQARKMNLLKEREHEDEGARVQPIEMLFEEVKVPSWKAQVTLRAFSVSFLLSLLFCVVGMNNSLKDPGSSYEMIVPAGLLGFCFIKIWTKFLEKCGKLKEPFTRQENVVIVSCVLASLTSSNIFFYLFAMSEVTAKQTGEVVDKQNTKNPSGQWIIGFLLLTLFTGLFSILPFRKSMMLDHDLTYPDATAASQLINSFHTPQTTKLAKRQVKVLANVFLLSFLWEVLKWFYSAGEFCGFDYFPTFGLRAFYYGFYFNFSAREVGAGMIYPSIINISYIIGAIIYWVLKSYLQFNKVRQTVPIGISLFLGDTLYYLFKVLIRTPVLLKRLQNEDTVPLATTEWRLSDKPSLSYNDQRRIAFFLKHRLPSSLAIGGYIASVAMSTLVLPYMFPQLKWYHVLMICIFTPIPALCVARYCGLTNQITSNPFGMLTMYIIGQWVGASHGNVLVVIVALNIVVNAIFISSRLMQDFKMGYKTLTSPNSIFVSNVIGIVMGCLINASVFWLFLKGVDDLGTPKSEYPVREGTAVRNAALHPVQVFSNLPKDSFLHFGVFFVAAIVINIIKDYSPNRWKKFVPIPTVMAHIFFSGDASDIISNCTGGLILFFWKKRNRAKAELYGPTIAAGLICGQELWSLPSSVLTLVGKKPPICMKFLSAGTNWDVQHFLDSQ